MVLITCPAGYHKPSLSYSTASFWTLDISVSEGTNGFWENSALLAVLTKLYNTDNYVSLSSLVEHWPVPDVAATGWGSCQHRPSSRRRRHRAGRRRPQKRRSRFERKETSFAGSWLLDPSSKSFKLGPAILSTNQQMTLGKVAWMWDNKIQIVSKT